MYYTTRGTLYNKYEFGIANRTLFDNLEMAIEYAKMWKKVFPNDFVNVVEICPCMYTKWESEYRLGVE